jgi:hypothetical protein
MKYYESKFFCPQEYVPPEVFDTLGDKSILLIDDRVLKTDDTIRDFFGKPVTINNWHTGGTRKYSGFRPHDCKDVGAPWSQHRFGRASDKIIQDVTAEFARSVIMDHRQLFPFVSCIEDGVSWLHTDCRALAGPEIYLFKP